MSEWMTAREAAKVLKVTDRMIGHYAAQGKLQIRREGRRVWYFSEDVQKLASELHTDLRPAQISRQDVNEGLVRYIQERQQADQEIIDRLGRIEAQITQPAPAPARGPSWQVIAALAIVLALALVVLAIVVRLF
jgi:hypothetical protein